MKTFAGDRLKRLRARHGLKQAALAQSIGISASYLNQIESDQRPITVPLLSRLVAALGVPETYFVDSEDARRTSQLREALGDPLFRGHAVLPEEVQALVRVAPEFGDAFIALYQAYTLRAESADQPAPVSRFPYDEVRDWVQARHNYFDPLDRAAAQLFETASFSSANLAEDLRRYLHDRHGIVMATDPHLLEQGNFWRLEPGGARLALAEEAAPESKIFWLAHVIGRLEQATVIAREVRRAQLSTVAAQGLAEVTLANYFAGALIMPYGRFHAAAQALRHDLQRLQSAFGASFEQICHRLSTMQRPDLPGVPFYFLKTDIAGNVLKRSSATRFQFAQFGGPCPLWNVFRAFAQPGEISLQLAVSPEQAGYLNIARTVGRGGGAYRSRPRAVAVMLGCEIRHAAGMVYAAGLDFHNMDAADPVGPGCRACERVDCRHRSVPPMGSAPDAGSAARGAVPYRMSE